MARASESELLVARVYPGPERFALASSVAALPGVYYGTENIEDIHRQAVVELVTSYGVGPSQDFIDKQLLRSDQVAWPVLRGREPVGPISLSSIRASFGASARPRTVADAMGALRGSVSPHLRGREALKILVESRDDPIPVVAAGQLVGLLYHADLMRWLALHEIETRRRTAY